MSLLHLALYPSAVVQKLTIHQETLRASNKDLESQVAESESQVAEIRAKLK
jgi:hypothetical protein